MSILTGFVEGIVRYTSDNSLQAIPFQSSIGSATLTYSGTTEVVKTFNSSGIKVASGACLTEIEATIEFTTSIASLGVLQAATGTLIETLGSNPTDEWVYSDSAALPSNGEINLSFQAVAGSAICTLEDGTKLTGTLDTPRTKFTVTTPTGNVGKRVTVSYKIAATQGQKVLRLGSGDRLPAVGLYGRFFGCEQTYLAQMNRVILAPNLSLGVGDGAAEISFTGTILADANDTLITLVKLD